MKLEASEGSSDLQKVNRPFSCSSVHQNPRLSTRTEAAELNRNPETCIGALDGGGASVGAQQRISAARSSNRLIRPELERVRPRRNQETVSLCLYSFMTSRNQRLSMKMDDVKKISTALWWLLPVWVLSSASSIILVRIWAKIKNFNYS